MTPRRPKLCSICRRDGFTLVELLVATVVAAVVLSAAYGWLWSVGALARVHDDRAQAETVAAAAVRAVTGDVRASMAVASPAPAHDPGRALTLVHDHISTAREAVTIAWDPARRVLWRNASGTYVADHVTEFSVEYDLGDGRLVTARALAAADWSTVRAVCITVVTNVGSGSATRFARVEVGS